MSGCPRDSRLVALAALVVLAAPAVLFWLECRRRAPLAPPTGLPGPGRPAFALRPPEDSSLRLAALVSLPPLPLAGAPSAAPEAVLLAAAPAAPASAPAAPVVSAEARALASRPAPRLRSSGPWAGSSYESFYRGVPTTSGARPEEDERPAVASMRAPR